MDCPPVAAPADGSPAPVGSIAAVGTFQPGIELWNLDVLDAMEPMAVLGGVTKTRGRGRRKMKLAKDSHKDSVMGLSWNRAFRNMLASSSADNTVKLWDVTTQACLHTFTHHTDKVQCVKWNPVTSKILLTGSFDKTAAVVDAMSVRLLFYVCS